jgi:SAM-dependent methyltransferase
VNNNLSTWEEAVAWLRSQRGHEELVRACFFDDPLIDAARRYHHSTEWQAVRQYLPRVSGAALDVGAGRGIASYALAMDGWKVTALEPNASKLVGANAIRSLAQEAHLEIKVEETWGERLPFADDSFDLVHARQVLHHAQDLPLLCKEAARVLKKNGVFLATREHVISTREDLPAFLALHPLHKLYGGEHAYLLQEYLDAIIKSGIKLSTVLNPYQSDINLYPETVEGLRRRVAKKLGLPPFMIPSILLSWRGAMNRIPGRLYTFVGRKS